MRVLLTQQFNKREPRTPIALLDLAAYGREYGHEVDVAYIDETAIRRLSLLETYDIVGLSSLTFSSFVLSEIENLRKKYKGRIVFGGKGTEVLQDCDCDNLAKLDVEVFSGSGERLFRPVKLLESVDIGYGDYPAWHEVDFHALDRVGQMTEMMSSRGCPYRCHFCQNTENRVHYFSPERTVVNAAMLLTTMHRHRIFLVDDIFAVSADRMSTILSLADDRGLNLRRRTCFFVHVSHVNDKTIESIREYNPQEVLVGVESGDDKMLEAMGKTFTSAQAEDRLRCLHSQGIRVSCLFLMGYPGETNESLQATVDFVERNRKYMSGWWVSYYQPVPFTKGWEQAVDRVGKDLVTGGWNTDINYLDPNLTAKELVDARWAVMTY